MIDSFAAWHEICDLLNAHETALSKLTGEVNERIRDMHLRVKSLEETRKNFPPDNAEKHRDKLAELIWVNQNKMSKLTERVEAIEAKAQGKGYYPPGIVERLEDIDDTPYCHDNRLKALEDQLSTFCPKTDNKTGENVDKSEPPDLSNYCGKYRPAQDVPCKMCGGTGQDDPPPGKYHGLCPRCGGNGKEPPAQGSYICDNCGHDFGTYIARGERCCPDRKPVWHQAQTVGKPAEVPTSSAAEKPPTSTAIEEPKPCPEGAENESGTLKEHEECDYCGALYATIYRLPDDIWDRIKPEDRFGVYELICPKCADKLARKNGIYLYWEATEGKWNRRPIEDELRAEIANLREQLGASEVEELRLCEELSAKRNKIANLKAEIERLKEARAVRDDHIDAHKADIAAAQGKIERYEEMERRVRDIRDNRLSVAMVGRDVDRRLTDALAALGEKE